jgi:hypothetical protein
MTDTSPAALAQGPATSDSPDEQRLARLQALADTLKSTWDEAVNGRKASGIEQQWIEDEEHYEGIDDANRGKITAAGGSDTKPPWQLTAAAVTEDTSSTEFVNITGPYVDAAAAKVGDILQPTDERSWSIGPTPIPELVKQARGIIPVDVVTGIATLPVPKHIKQAVLVEEVRYAMQILEEAKEKAERAQKRIEDWHIEGQFHAAVREIIEDSAKAGCGVLKGPIPEKKRQQMFKDGVLVIQEVTKPISKRVDYWNVFPDPSCGTNPHNGSYLWERDYLTPRKLEDLKGTDGYLDDQIDLCLREGPGKKSDPRKTAEGNVLDDKDTFEVRYFWGYAKRDELEATGWQEDPECPLPTGCMQVPVIFTIVNDRVIRGTVSHLDTGEFPYDFFRWRKMKNSPWGKGIGRQIRSAQRIVTAAVRVMLTNAGRAAGPLVVLADNVYGADGKDDILPWKVYRIRKASAEQDTTKAVSLVEIPALTAELMQIVQMGLKLAEDTTGLPMLLQGQKGDAPDTYGGQQLVDRNASSTLRRLARNFDDDVNEPHVRRYYTYLLLYGPEDIEKGEFIIDARGSTALVERELERQEANSLLQASLNPAFGLDPKKTMAEKLRADRRDPEAYQYDEEEWERMQRQRAQQQPAPAVAAAQIRETGATQRKKMELEAASKEKALDRALEQVALQVSERLQGMKSEGEREQTIMDIKGMLAAAVMKLRTQRQLSLSDQTHERDIAIGEHKMDHFKHTNPPPQVLTPPTEPAGRAPAGEAFEK